MAAVDIFDVKVLGNPAPFTNALQFEITYEVREALKEDIEWKVVYVGSADDQTRDQELDAVLLPASAPGKFMFVLEVPAPDPTLIPDSDVHGVTIVLLTCAYKTTEFIRVGYYVSNEYPDAEMNENPPARPDVARLTRTIAAHEPRVTRFPHKFDFDQAPALVPSPDTPLTAAAAAAAAADAPVPMAS